MATTALRDYWVRFNGTLIEGGPHAAESGQVNVFLDFLTAALATDGDSDSPGVIRSGENEILISGVVRAASEGGAVDVARAVFEAAIEAAGGTHDLGDDSKGFSAHALRLREARVRELQDA